MGATFTRWDDNVIVIVGPGQRVAECAQRKRTARKMMYMPRALCTIQCHKLCIIMYILLVLVTTKTRHCVCLGWLPVNLRVHQAWF